MFIKYMFGKYFLKNCKKIILKNIFKIVFKYF